MRKLYILLLFTVFAVCLTAQPVSKNDLPFIGAQVFIEPGQTELQVDAWYKEMECAGMTVCRIRMFQQYMEKSDGTWDFTLFDRAFDAAQRHHVKVYATLFPTTKRTDIGGWKFPHDDAQQASFANFIRNAVTHYRNHPALKGWVLINEPGTDGLEIVSDVVESAWKDWQKSNPDNPIGNDGFPNLTVPRRQNFVYEYTANYLHWIADEVRKYDTKHDIHVNPANVFGNIAEYDWQSWQTFLTSLGGSAHPVWHYDSFTRPQFTLAMTIESEILKSGAGSLPWFMTEIQGGNNTWSGHRCICPTPQEIAQWLWTVIGTEGKGAIFWMLNPRSSGIEAGEWALLNFQNKPSKRMKTASCVANCIKDNSKLFSKARQQKSAIDIIYSKESFWAEQLMSNKEDVLEARRPMAIFKSVAACYQALAGRGIQAGIWQLDNYDFSKKDYTGHTIIIPNQIALPNSAQQKLERFVSLGGNLIVEGLTAFFDENLHNNNTIDFYWKRLFGGQVSEYICRDSAFTVCINGLQVPAGWQQGLLAGSNNSFVSQSFGKGHVLWIPSCLVLQAWNSGDYVPLSNLLAQSTPIAKGIAFDKYYDGITLRVLKSGDDIVTVCINKSKQAQTVNIVNMPDGLKPEVLYKLYSQTPFTLQPEDVQVILWKK